MQDHPTSLELINAVAQFLNAELAPTLSDPRLKFRALVAANVLNIVARELELSDAQLRAERERLNELLSENASGENLRADVERMTRELSQKIRAGEADEGAFHNAVFAHVEQTVIEKLQVTNPKYLARVLDETADNAE
ncbi:MAG: hypothetical protein EYC68_11455 [Chloroflexota bacterium]|nr:MAG: hypothetical protein EYC68_11455 [Chloroflexota bacterium]